MSTHGSGSENGGRKIDIGLWITGAVVLSLIAAYFLIPGAKDWAHQAWGVISSGDQERIQEWVQRYDPWGPALTVALFVLQMFLVVVPSFGLMLVCILAYGKWWGSVLCVVGILTASSVGYLIGRLLGKGAVTRLVSDSAEKKMEGYVEDYGLWAVIVFRMAPFLSNDAVSFVAGLVRMSYLRFILATLIGIVPLTALLAFMSRSPERLKQGLIYGSAVSLVLLITYIIWDRRRNGSENSSD